MNSKRHKVRTEEDKNALKNRLSRIEGQVRGLIRMVEEDAYCTDVLTQASAARAALNSFAKEVLRDHIESCVVQDIQQGDMEVLDDLVQTIYRFMR